MDNACSVCHKIKLALYVESRGSLCYECHYSKDEKREYEDAAKHALRASGVVDILNSGHADAPFQVVDSVSALRDNAIKLECGLEDSGRTFSLWLYADQCERLALRFESLARYLRLREEGNK